MQADIYIQFATIIGFATILGVILHLLKQPLVAAYLLAGVLLSFFQVVRIPISSPLTFLPTIGIAFLLFLIGMELDVNELRMLGKPIVLATTAQVAIMTAAIAVVMTMLKFSTSAAILTGLALSFSSTIVVIKLLVDKHEIASFHGKVALGILLLQDLIAIVVLMILSFIGNNDVNGGVGDIIPIALFLFKGVALFFGLLAIIHVAIRRFFRIVAENHELLFLSAIAWCFVFIVVSLKLGFSLEIGAFLAGLSLASSPYRFQIAGRLKPLRDLFIAIFFVNLGQSVLFTDVQHNVTLILVFVLIALVLKPIIFMVILSLFGLRRYTVYQASTAMSQISEFSIIIFFAAQSFGLLDHTLISAMTIATMLTIFISAILINQNNYLYGIVRFVSGKFDRFKAPRQSGNGNANKLRGHTILIGATRYDDPVVSYLQEKLGEKFVVVDSNPALIEQLSQNGTAVLFGDITDPDILEQLNVDHALLIISTIPSRRENMVLLDTVKRLQSEAIVIVVAETDDEADHFYKLGADEVIVPSHLEGLHVINLLAHHWQNLKSLKQNRVEQA